MSTGADVLKAAQADSKFALDLLVDPSKALSVKGITLEGAKLNELIGIMRGVRMDLFTKLSKFAGTSPSRSEFQGVVCC
jgi:hypothetical protein